MSEREFHPVANLFPLLEGAEFRDLCRDIEDNGLLVPIWLHPDGRIIDGRNRYRACLDTMIEPQFRTWSGDGSLVAFAVSLNLKRRQLNTGQRAIVALNIMEYLEPDAKKRQGQRSDIRAILPEGLPRPRDQAAKSMNVSPRYVQDAKKLKAEAPELFAKVRSGDLTIPQAKRKAWPPQETEVTDAWQDVVNLAGQRGIDPEVVAKSVRKITKANSTTTYKNQPAIDKTKGAVPLEGTEHVYTVGKLLWPEAVEDTIEGFIIGSSLHVCCGKSLLGDVRLDMDPENNPDILCDASSMAGFVADDQFDTVICDPPYNGQYQWNHDLLTELARVAKKRIIFQHWFIPANKHGEYRKDTNFTLSKINIWQGKTIFGRAQVISVFDHE